MNDYTPSLARLATLAQHRPRLIASLLAIYKEQEDMNDEQIAAQLRCDSEALVRLALCRRPRSLPHFWKDVERIATHVHADPFQLANLLRIAEAVEQMQQQQGESFLLAARDRDELLESEQED